MSSAPKPQAKSSRRSSWKQNPVAVQANILRVAKEVFSRDGLSGARVDEIAARTDTSKRMIYYYFGDKEGLYLRTLEEAYRSVREQEGQLDLEGLDPVSALRRLVEFTFEHHSRNPDFSRLVMIENIQAGRYLEKSEIIRGLNRGVIAELEGIIARGKALGLFREEVDPLVVHWQISALSFFNVSNQHTFAKIFGDSLSTPEGQSQLEEENVQAILGGVLVNSAVSAADRPGAAPIPPDA